MRGYTVCVRTRSKEGEGYRVFVFTEVEDKPRLDCVDALEYDRKSGGPTVYGK